MAESNARSARTGRSSFRKPTVKHRKIVAARLVRDAASGEFSKKSAAGTKKLDGELIELNIRGRAETVAKALGSRAKLAKVLNVSASQPTRWISGDESPNSENTRAIVDLEHVVTRARLLWSDDETVSSWLNGRNAFLDGARPVDVVATQGAGLVIDALDQETAGAYA